MTYKRNEEQETNVRFCDLRTYRELKTWKMRSWHEICDLPRDKKTTTHGTTLQAKKSIMGIGWAQDKLTLSNQATAKRYFLSFQLWNMRNLPRRECTNNQLSSVKVSIKRYWVLTRKLSTTILKKAKQNWNQASAVLQWILLTSSMNYLKFLRQLHIEVIIMLY